jgi:hypothetical protein
MTISSVRDAMSGFSHDATEVMKFGNLSAFRMPK